jgi:hypothetical protein
MTCGNKNQNTSQPIAQTSAGVKVAFLEVYAICYKENGHTILAGKHTSMTYGNKKNETRHVPTCLNLDVVFSGYQPH